MTATRKQLIETMTKACKEIAVYAIATNKGDVISAQLDSIMIQHYKNTVDGFHFILTNLYPKKQAGLPLIALKHAIAAVVSEWDELYQWTLSKDEERGIRLFHLSVEPRTPGNIPHATKYMVENSFGRRFFFDKKEDAQKLFNEYE